MQRNAIENELDSYASMLFRNSLFLSRCTSTLKPIVVAEINVGHKLFRCNYVAWKQECNEPKMGLGKKVSMQNA